jgi:hypothetical protein
MKIRLLLPWILGTVLTAACGTDGTGQTGSHSEVVKAMTPREAVAEIKLQLEKYRTYQYCDQTYPQVCDTLPIAYVLPREGSEPYRVILYSNQDINSTWVFFDYLTIDAESREIATVGAFQWRKFAGNLETKGTAQWGVPQ